MLHAVILGYVKIYYANSTVKISCATQSGAHLTVNVERKSRVKKRNLLIAKKNQNFTETRACIYTKMVTRNNKTTTNLFQKFPVNSVK